MEPPQNPAGAFVPEDGYDAKRPRGLSRGWASPWPCTTRER
jgi:hypothetical protein